jgi:hypothetical protein
VTQQADELNDIGRNFLLGNGKKIAKFLMRTFACCSTFLYDISPADAILCKEVKPWCPEICTRMYVQHTICALSHLLSISNLENLG